MRKIPSGRSCSTEDVMETCALFHSRRAARAITAFYDRHLKAAGVKATHFSLLVAVEEAEGRPLSEIAAYMAMDRTSLARDLRILEELGLLTIAVPESDRRTRLMTLTTEGKRIVAEGLPHWRKAQDGLEAAMTVASWPDVRAALELTTAL